MIRRISITCAFIAGMVGLVFLFDLFLPLWLAIISSVLVIPLVIYVIAGLLYVAYPVLFFIIFVLWGLYSEGNRK